MPSRLSSASPHLVGKALRDSTLEHWDTGLGKDPNVSIWSSASDNDAKGFCAFSQEDHGTRDFCAFSQKDQGIQTKNESWDASGSLRHAASKNEEPMKIFLSQTLREAEQQREKRKAACVDKLRSENLNASFILAAG